MRSVFPALHDRLLTKLLLGAVILLVAAVVASFRSEAPAKIVDEGPPLFISGGTTPSKPGPAQ